MKIAKIYIRRNGTYGSRTDAVADTGHHIVEDSGRFTVYSIHDDERIITKNADRAEAEAAIAEDWAKED